MLDLLIKMNHFSSSEEKIKYLKSNLTAYAKQKSISAKTIESIYADIEEHGYEYFTIFEKIKR